MQVMALWRGLEIHGTVDYDPGDFHTPAVWDTTIDEILLEDPDEFHGHDMLSSMKLSEGALRMIQAWDNMNEEGNLLPLVERHIRSYFAEDLEYELEEKY